MVSRVRRAHDYPGRCTHNWHCLENSRECGRFGYTWSDCSDTESMKMEVPVCSPAAGIVHSIGVSNGESVEDGDALVTLTS